MKIYAVITSILIASSSVALADDHAFQNDPRFGEHGELAWSRPGRAVWSPLSEMITASRSNVIRLDDCRDELRRLRLQSGTGATYIYSVTLQLEDGSRERVDVGQWLYWGVPTLAVELPHRRTGVERIVVNTWTWFPSTYRVFGQRVQRAPGMPPLPPPPPPPSAGVVIGKDLTFAHTAGYIQIPVGAEKGSFGKLRIEATGALTFLGRIYVTFWNGPSQTFDVNKPLSRGEALTLDLTGAKRTISAITVMAGDDLRAVGHAGSRFSVTLL